MKVSVYKDDEEKLTVWVEPSLGRGLAPVLIRGITRENAKEMVGPVVAHLRRQDTRALGRPPGRSD